MQGFEVHSGDILVSCAGTIGETYILPEDIEQGIINQALMRIRLSELVYAPYFLLYFDYVLKENAKADSNGSAIKNIPPFNILKKYAFALPPLPEQQRIVDRVEALMKEIDKLEQTEKELESIKAAFPGDMKASLLQAAMEGKLTTQKADDGDARGLLRAIREEKEKLVKEKKIKKEKPLTPITDEEIPFDIPENWVWCRLGEISTYASPKSKINAKEADKDTWMLDLEDIEKGGKLLAKLKVSDKKAIGDKTIFHDGDILYSKLRPYLLKILVASDDGICTPELIPFSMYGNIDTRYIVDLLKSPYVDNAINGATYGLKMPRVGTNTMINLPIPLPPLPEQQRIVEKLDQLLPLCDSLSEH